MSAPARACESASSASSLSVGSLATSPFSITPQCPWLVYSHKQTSVITTSLSFARRIASIARCTAPVADQASDPRSSLCSGRPNSMIRRNPQPFHFAALLDQLVRRLLAHARHRADFRCARRCPGKQTSDK